MNDPDKDKRQQIAGASRAAQIMIQAVIESAHWDGVTPWESLEKLANVGRFLSRAAREIAEPAGQIE